MRARANADEDRELRLLYLTSPGLRLAVGTRLIFRYSLLRAAAWLSYIPKPMRPPHINITLDRNAKAAAAAAYWAGGAAPQETHEKPVPGRPGVNLGCPRRNGVDCL